MGSEIAAQNRKSLATFHRTLKSQCALLCLVSEIARFLGSAMGIEIANPKNRCDFGALSLDPLMNRQKIAKHSLSLERPARKPRHATAFFARELRHASGFRIPLYTTMFKSFSFRHASVFKTHRHAVYQCLNQKNPRVRKIRVRNSGAGNGCANFMDTWKNAFSLQEKPCP